MNLIKKSFKVIIPITLSLILVFSNSVSLALTPSQRTIFNQSIQYYNECLTGGSGGAVISGENKDYKGNPIFTDDELKKIEELSPFYVKAAEKYNMPWQILAVIHKRESDFMKGGPSNLQGPYQDYMHRGEWPAGDYDDALFQKATDRAAEEFSGMAGGKDLNTPEGVKYAFFGYNGRASVYKRQALSLGFSQEEADNGEGSPYVMNMADAKRDPDVASPGTWGQIKRDNGPIEYPANKIHGAYVMYAAIGGETGGGTAAVRNNGRFIWTGDSRTEGMKLSVKEGNNEWVSKGSMGYDWFNSEAIPKINEKLKDGDTIVFNFGINDLSNVDKYKKRLNELADGDWAKASKIIVMSVNPVDEDKEAQYNYSTKNADIEKFNNEIKNGLNAKIEYSDIYNKIKNDFKTFDGLHYEVETYNKIYDLIRGTASNDSICSDGSAALTGTNNEKMATLAKEWGTWGETYNACYAYGGGHQDQGWMDKAIENHFTGSYAVDCSAFVSAVIYKATGKYNMWSTSSMCSDTKNFQVVTDNPQPGDLAISCSSHVEVITAVNSDGSFETVGAHSTGCGAGKGASPANYKGDKVLRYIGK